MTQQDPRTAETQIELPPLPQAEFPGVVVRGHKSIPRYLFTASQMQAYARQAIAHGRQQHDRDMRLCEAALDAEIKHSRKLQAELDRQQRGEAVGYVCADDNGEPIGRTWFVKTSSMNDSDGRNRMVPVYLGPQPAEPVKGEPSVPDGWQLVPIDPTDLMTARGQEVRYPTSNSIMVIYQTMLAASPTPPAVEQAQPATALPKEPK